jgi:hypothetical protein
VIAAESDTGCLGPIQARSRSNSSHCDKAFAYDRRPRRRLHLRWSSEVVVPQSNRGKEIGSVTPRFSRDRGSAAVAALGRGRNAGLDL